MQQQTKGQQAPQNALLNYGARPTKSVVKSHQGTDGQGDPYKIPQIEHFNDHGSTSL
jgi:hypothetical protein